MRDYLTDPVFKIGLVLLVVGTGPLTVVILLAKLGLTSDPNPNPVGPGLLAGLTMWPAVILIAIGATRVRGRR
jgi:hypothetical protein